MVFAIIVFAIMPFGVISADIPKEWHAPIKKYSAIYKLNETRVLRLVEHESQGQAGMTRNRNGTYDFYPMGLNTLTVMDIRRDYPDFDPTDYYQNIAHGIRILRDRVKTFGNWYDAVGSWNMGITGYRKFLDGKIWMPDEAKLLIKAVIGWV